LPRTCIGAAVAIGTAIIGGIVTGAVTTAVAGGTAGIVTAAGGDLSGRRRRLASPACIGAKLGRRRNGVRLPASPIYGRDKD
jgi:hypothetical protein